MQQADHILIPLLDGRHALAQIVDVQGSRAVLFLTHHIYGDDHRTFAIDGQNVLSILATDLSTLPAGAWPIIGYETIPRLANAKIDLSSDETALHDPAIIEAFANAIHGQYPWDGFPDPAFFTTLLRAPDVLPPKVIFTKDLPTPDQS